MKKKSLWMCAAVALVVAGALAGCGSTTYFAGRNLPPSGLTHRVMIAVQNPSIVSKGTLNIVDAYYDIRSSYDDKIPSFAISGYSSSLPITIQNMPEEQEGMVYGSGDGSLIPVSYAHETANGGVSGLNGLSSSVFATRNGSYVFAANQASAVFTVISQVGGASYPFSLPGVYRVSTNPGGSIALVFVQNSPYIYYPIRLTGAQTTAYSGGPSTWPKAAWDCEPQNEPAWCLFQAQSPDKLDTKTNTYYGAPLSFDHPVKAVFSADGGTAYVLNCGPECGGSQASVSVLPVSPMIFLTGQGSGQLPTASALSAPCTGSGSGCTIPVPGGATNALVTNSTLYVVGQQPVQVQGQTLFAGNLTVLNLLSNSVVPATPTVPNPASISDGVPGGVSRMLLADDNTLWIAMTKCTNGVRLATGASSGYGCLTMVNTTNNTVTMLEPYLGDATGIAAVTGLHKIYTAEGGQVYIYSTVDGTAIDNQYVTVTGVAYDVAYMDAETDGDNTVY